MTPIREFVTKTGARHVVVRVKRAPGTLKKVIGLAQEREQGLRWTILFEHARVGPDPDRPAAPCWVSGRLPKGWSARDLLEHIEHPRKEEGDSWKAGDVNAALVAIALKQQSHIWDARTPVQYDVFTVAREEAGERGSARRDQGGVW